MIGGAAVLVALLLGAAGAAFANPGHGAGTETVLEKFRDTTETEAGENPCNGEKGTVTLAAKNGKVHVTTHEDGNLWVTGTFVGEFTFTPENPAGVVYNGHFQQWFGVSVNEKNAVEHFTSNTHVTGTDGSTVGVHMNGHVSTNARGEVKVSFEKATFLCT
jgi:hypothetical protein